MKNGANSYKNWRWEKNNRIVNPVLSLSCTRVSVTQSVHKIQISFLHIPYKKTSSQSYLFSLINLKTNYHIKTPENIYYIIVPKFTRYEIINFSNDHWCWTLNMFILTSMNNRRNIIFRHINSHAVFLFFSIQKKKAHKFLLQIQHHTTEVFIWCSRTSF